MTKNSANAFQTRTYLVQHLCPPLLGDAAISMLILPKHLHRHDSFAFHESQHITPNKLKRPRPMSGLICPRVAPGIGFLLAILARTPNAAAAAQNQMLPSSCAGSVVSFKTQWISALVNLAHEYPVSGVVAEREALQTMLPCLSTCRLALLVRRGLWSHQ